MIGSDDWILPKTKMIQRHIHNWNFTQLLSFHACDKYHVWCCGVGRKQRLHYSWQPPYIAWKDVRSKNLWTNIICSPHIFGTVWGSLLTFDWISSHWLEPWLALSLNFSLKLFSKTTICLSISPPVEMTPSLLYMSILMIRSEHVRLFLIKFDYTYL